jgi:hypothetical protein
MKTGACINYFYLQCRCPFQFTGTFCENPTNYSEVSLLPSSWILFRIASALNDTEQPGFTHSLEATFRIVSEEGIVFTLAEADDGYFIEPKFQFF